MRISKVTWLILSVGILALAAAGLYMLYQDQLEEQENLNQSISVAQAALPGLISEKGNLEDQLVQLEDELAQAEVRLSQAEAQWPESVQSIFYGDLLFSLAESLDLEVISFTATEPTEMEEEGINYEVTYLVVIVKGEVANVLQYITRIEVDDEFKTASIQAVSTTIPLPLTEAAKEAIRAAEIERLIREAVGVLPGQERLSAEDIVAMIEGLRGLIEELGGLTAEEIAAITVDDIEAMIEDAMGGVREELTAEDIAKLIGKLEEIIGKLETLGERLAAEEIAEQEMPLTTINLRILSYES